MSTRAMLSSGTSRCKYAALEQLGLLEAVLSAETKGTTPRDDAARVPQSQTSSTRNTWRARQRLEQLR